MKIVITILVCLAALPAQASENILNERMDAYRAQGGADFDADRGKRMWAETHTQSASGKSVSCTSCHSANLKQTGSHIRTGKLIEPMAASTAGADRFKDPAKIEKWFLRNCKWTLGRECTAQEKGDFLAWFLSQ